MEQTLTPVEMNAQLVVSSSGTIGLSGVIVQGSVQGISESLTTQTLSQLNIKDSITTLTDSTGEHDSQITGENINIASLSGGEGVRQYLGGEIVPTQGLSGSSMEETIHTSMEKIPQTSTQHNLEGFVELEIGTLTNLVTFSESISQSEVLDVTTPHGRESVHEAVADETVQESTQEVSQSSAILTTQTDKAINAVVITWGGNIVPDYVCELGRDGPGMRVFIGEQVHESEEESSSIIGQATMEAAQSIRQETVYGTTTEAVAIGNIGVDATFSSSGATEIISQSSEILQDSS